MVDDCELRRRIGVVSSVLGARQLGGPTLAKKQRTEPRGPRKPAGLVVVGRAHHRHTEHHVRCLEDRRGSEGLAIGGQGRLERVGTEVVGEAEGQSEHPSEVRRVGRRAEQPHLGTQTASRHGQLLCRTGEVADQLDEIIGKSVGIATTESPGGRRVRAGRTTDAEIDAARVERFEGAELLGNDQRSMVGQHHPT